MMFYFLSFSYNIYLYVDDSYEQNICGDAKVICTDFELIYYTINVNVGYII